MMLAVIAGVSAIICNKYILINLIEEVFMSAAGENSSRLKYQALKSFQFDPAQFITDTINN